jgi:hypothetical protein
MKTMMMEMNNQVLEIQKLRRSGYSYREIATKLKVPLKRAWKYGREIKMSSRGLKRYSKIRLPRPIKSQRSKLTLRKARIISHLLFDGSVFAIKKSYSYIIRYTNKSRKLVNQFINDMKKVYGIDPSSMENERNVFKVTFKSKRVYDDLLTYTPTYSSSNETTKIPEKIMKGTVRKKLVCLRAFWDDEGSISSEGEITGDLRSKTMIEQLKELNNELGIKCNFYEYLDGGKPMYKLYIFKNRENLERFLKLNLFTDSIVTRGKFKGLKKIDVLRKFLIN